MALQARRGPWTRCGKSRAARERDADGTLAVTKCPTADNLADLFTKALDRDPFTKLSRLVLNVLASGALLLILRARRIAAKTSSA